jgi:hypothetical protein
LSRFVQVEVKQEDRPGKLGTLVRGAQSERPKRRDKAAWERSTVCCEVSCISKVDEDREGVTKI